MHESISKQRQFAVASEDDESAIASMKAVSCFPVLFWFFFSVLFFFFVFILICFAIRF